MTSHEPGKALRIACRHSLTVIGTLAVTCRAMPMRSRRHNIPEGPGGRCPESAVRRPVGPGRWRTAGGGTRCGATRTPRGLPVMRGQTARGNLMSKPIQSTGGSRHANHSGYMPAPCGSTRRSPIPAFRAWRRRGCPASARAVGGHRGLRVLGDHAVTIAEKFPLKPKTTWRIRWGSDKYSRRFCSRAETAPAQPNAQPNARPGCPVRVGTRKETGAWIPKRPEVEKLDRHQAVYPHRL
jgi:hypothetical protein